MITKFYHIKKKASQGKESVGCERWSNVSFTGKVRLEPRPEGIEGAVMGDKAFPVKGITKVIKQESTRLFKKIIPRRRVKLENDELVE